MYDLTVIIEARLLNRFGKPSSWLHSTTVKETFICEDIEEVFRITDSLAKEFEIVSANFRKVKPRKDETQKVYVEEDEC